MEFPACLRPRRRCSPHARHGRRSARPDAGRRRDPQAEHLPALPAPGRSAAAAGRRAGRRPRRLARQAAAPATLRAYKADWQHFAALVRRRTASSRCRPHPAMVGAYLASLAESHAPSTIRRRLAALGKMHRFNDLPWNPAHRDIQEPLRGLLRQHGRPVQKAAALTLAMLRQLLATCDSTARGRRDRALLLFGFAGALRRSELVALQVEDVAVVAGGLRLRIAAQQDRPGRGRGPRSACRAASMSRPARCGPSRPGRRWPNAAPARCSAASAPAGRSATPRCTPTRCGGSWRTGSRMAGLSVEGFERLSAHALRVGFITEAYGKGVRDEDIMRHTRHRDLRTMRGYVQRAGLLTESPAGLLDL